MDTIVVFDPAPGPASGFTITALTPQVENGGGADPRNFTFDLSAFGAGDLVVVAYGNRLESDGATLAGNAMTARTKNDATIAGFFIATYEYELTGAGSASTTIAIDLPDTVSTSHLIAVAVIEGGAVFNSGDWGGTRGATVNTSVSVTDTTNAIVAFAMTEFGGEGLTNWVGATEQVETGNGIDGYVAIATNTDVSTGTHNVDVDPVSATATADEDTACITLCYETS